MDTYRLDGIELDVRFSEGGLKEFSFERLKEYEDCTKNEIPKDSVEAIVTLEQCFEELAKFK